MTSPLNRRPAPAPQPDMASDTLRMKTDRYLESVRTLHERQAAITLAMRRSLKALEKLPGDMYTRQWFLAREDQIKAAAKKALDDAEEAAAERIQQAREAATEAAKREAPANNLEAMLFEQQVANAWTGLKMLLERAATQEDGLKAITAAAESVGADPVRIEALRKFGPDWVAGTFANERRIARENILGALHAGIDAAEFPTLSPVQKTAREILQNIDRGEARLQESSREVRKEIERYDGKIAAAVVGWADDSVVMLTERGQPLSAEAANALSANLEPDARAWEIAAAKNHPMLTEAGALRGTEFDPRNAPVRVAGPGGSYTVDPRSLGLGRE